MMCLLPSRRTEVSTSCADLGPEKIGRWEETNHHHRENPCGRSCRRNKRVDINHAGLEDDPRVPSEDWPFYSARYSSSDG